MNNLPVTNEAIAVKQKAMDERFDVMSGYVKEAIEKFNAVLVQKKEQTKSEQEVLELIKRVAAPGANDDEFKTLIHLSKVYNLDPLKKEIWFIKYGSGKPIIMTSRDGYLKIANADPMFDGIESDAVYEDDTMTRRDDTSFLITYGPHHINHNKDKLKGAFCNVFRRDRSVATSVFVPLKDYYKNSDIWKQYTYAMIIKVAEAMALKRAFSLSALVTREEVGEYDEKEHKDAITIPSE